MLRLGGAKQRSVLALLLLHADEAISTDRLVDELWGAHPPDDAPTALQQHVSRLRKVLSPHDVLRTRAPGYVVELDGHDLDLRRFEQLRERGTRELDESRPADAARTLRQALELWRGRPLADLENEPFAHEAVARLDEAWLEALVARVEADLQLGRHAELIPELRSLVRRYPLHEALRTQLILALYRSGRQSEALDEYAAARRTLVDELGLDPSPSLQRLQQAILQQDPSLEVPRRPLLGGKSPRLVLVALAGAAIAVALAAVAAFATGAFEGGDEAASTAEGRILALDARRGEVRREIAAGRTPSAIAVGDGFVWVVDADAQTVLRVQEDSGEVETFSTGATATDVAATSGAAWVANGRPLENAQFVGPIATAVTQLEATSGTERVEARLPWKPRALSNLVENHVALTQHAVWAVTPDFGVARIASATGAVTAVFRQSPAAAIAAGGGGLWVLGVDGSVVLLDERTARPVLRTRVPSSAVTAIAAGEHAAWVTSSAEGSLWRIEAARRPTIGTIEVGRGVSDVAVGTDAVWVANPLAGTLVQVDPAAGRVTRTIDVEGIPRSLAVSGDTVWIAAVAEPAASRSAEHGVHAFMPPTCEPVISGKGEADVLVVSDLPLQGGVRVRTTQMAQAIAFVLRERGFRAGRFSVAYQSCDDSIARTGLYDEAKCAANARAYGANRDVVGVIGTFNSGCTIAALPELNRAPGPLAAVSPFNSFVGLTRAGPGVDPSLPGALYPTGRRNYVRVYPTDDLQGAALAQFTRDEGRRRVFVLDDGDPGYGALLATGFETAARRLGLTVLGHASWNPAAAGYARLADRVARVRPDAVFVGGLLDTNAASVIRELRHKLGPRPLMLGPDGLTGVPLLIERAGRAALGTYLSLAGVVTERLPAAGARFVRRFARTQPGTEIEPSAVYAAQAADLLLDAIVRSDGTRGSIVRELFRTRVRNGLLGSFGFDRNGDISESPITIVRVVGGGRSRTIESVEGAVVERVVRPGSRLVAPEE